jgi:hypothetical protein
MVFNRLTSALKLSKLYTVHEISCVRHGPVPVGFSEVASALNRSTPLSEVAMQSLQCPTIWFHVGPSRPDAFCHSDVLEDSALPSTSCAAADATPFASVRTV